MIRLRLSLLFLASACSLAPEYRRPVAVVPSDFRASGPPEQSFADLEWWKVFQDPALQELTRVALEQNLDVRIAAERVLEARARVTIAGADRFPSLGAGARKEYYQTTENGPVPLGNTDPEQQLTTVEGLLDWELDFWGRIRSASEAARADLLATEMARNFVIQTLVSEVATAYFELLELDSELDIARRTVESREKSRQLVQYRLDEGVANMVALRQAEALVLTAQALIPSLEQRIVEQENRIRLLLGDNPGPVARGSLRLEHDREIEIPVGLPSDLLTRRPDVQAAELTLIAANARIGEARARLFPTIRLTGAGGYASKHLSDLFDGGSTIWSIVPSVTAPIFQGGRLRAGVEVAESVQRQAALQYVLTLRGAFRDVSDALIAHEKTREVREKLEQLTSKLANQSELSRDRYLGGVTSYLEVLNSERDYFASELDLARAVRDTLTSTVQLYRALGGGWQTARDEAASGKQEVAVAGSIMDS